MLVPGNSQGTETNLWPAGTPQTKTEEVRSPGSPGLKRTSSQIVIHSASYTILEHLEYENIRLQARYIPPRK
jgi:hypothetical protein